MAPAEMRIIAVGSSSPAPPTIPCARRNDDNRRGAVWEDVKLWMECCLISSGGGLKI